MNTIILKSRLWLVLLVPICIAIGTIYFIAARTAKSYHPINVFEAILSDGLIGVVVSIVVFGYLFFKLANGRLTEITLNDVGIQSSYFNSDSKWVDWTNIKEVNVSYNKVVLKSIFNDLIEIPLILFSKHDKALISEAVSKYANKGL